MFAVQQVELAKRRNKAQLYSLIQQHSTCETMAYCNFSTRFGTFLSLFNRLFSRVLVS